MFYDKYKQEIFQYKEVLLVSKALMRRWHLEPVIAPSLDDARVEFNRRIALGHFKILYEHPDGLWHECGPLPEGFRLLIVDHENHVGENEISESYFAVRIEFSNFPDLISLETLKHIELPKGSLKWSSEERRWILYSN